MIYDKDICIEDFFYYI
jgi:hypothetical protein